MHIITLWDEKIEIYLIYYLLIVIKIHFDKKTSNVSFVKELFMSDFSSELVDPVHKTVLNDWFTNWTHLSLCFFVIARKTWTVLQKMFPFVIWQHDDRIFTFWVNYSLKVVYTVFYCIMKHRRWIYNNSECQRVLNRLCTVFPILSHWFVKTIKSWAALHHVWSLLSHKKVNLFDYL